MIEKIFNQHSYALANTLGIKLPKEAKEFILRAMNEYAGVCVSKAIDMKPREKLSIVKVWLSGTKQEFILHFRLKNLKRAKRMAIKMANEDNRKYYVVRSSETEYTTLSTSDVDHNRRIRVFGKNVDAKTMHQTADFVALPNHRC
jgi:hypothetical protein